MKIEIRERTMREAIDLMRQVPEMADVGPLSLYEERIQNKPHLILLAQAEAKPAGFKIAYQRDHFFYS